MYQNRYEVMYVSANVRDPQVYKRSGMFANKKDAYEYLKTVVPEGLVSVNKKDYDGYTGLLEGNVYKHFGSEICGKFVSSFTEEMDTRKRVYFVDK